MDQESKLPIDKNKIKIPNEILEIWQRLLDFISDSCNVPAALIMKIQLPNIEVFLTSKSKLHPYKVGSNEHLIGSGLYCEKVYKTKKELLVPNALKDKEWDKNPDIKLGLISYFGYPIFWPDGDVFGTLCILDYKENHYKRENKELMLKAKPFIEKYLDIILTKHMLKNRLIDIRKGSDELDKKEMQYGELLKEILTLLPKK